MKSAAKVGLLLVVFVVLFLASFSVLGRSLIYRNRRTIFVDMPDAGGINLGTRVLMAGVQIGTVQKIDLVNPHKAILTLDIDGKYHLPLESRAVIAGSVIGLGDTPLSIDAPEGAAGTLADNATIPGSKAGPLDGLLPNGGKDLYGNVNQTLVAVKQLLQDRKLQDGLKTLLKTANTTLEASQTTLARFNALADQTNGLLAKNQGNLSAMIAGMKGTIEQVHYTAGALATFVREGKLQKGTTALMDKAAGIENEASRLLAQLNSIAADPSIAKDIKATMHNAAATTEKGPAIADNAQKITANLADVTERAKKLPDALTEVANKASKLEDRLSSLLDKVDSVKPPSTKGLKDFTTELDLFRETNPGYWRTDINGSLPTRDGFVTFGIYDAFESNKLNIQIGKNISSKLAYRYGVYGSKPAIGVDYQLTPKIGLRADLWNINSPELDARLRYDFGGGLYGFVGADKIYNRTSAVIGLGIRK